VYGREWKAAFLRKGFHPTDVDLRIPAEISGETHGYAVAVDSQRIVPWTELIASC